MLSVESTRRWDVVLYPFRTVYISRNYGNRLFGFSGLLFSRLNRVTISLRVAVYKVNISFKELLADIGLHFNE